MLHKFKNMRFFTFVLLVAFLLGANSIAGAQEIKVAILEGGRKHACFLRTP